MTKYHRALIGPLNPAIGKHKALLIGRASDGSEVSHRIVIARGDYAAAAAYVGATHGVPSYYLSGPLAGKVIEAAP